ncbi:hypothetical protein N7495_001403 [Penicillium taxi]|uniref:uncharacterized protein n=1 Tax=Penicillium taxi TaxID=168475 RepID=UPI002545698B|nr:uncharacterized protein N7495_001403 [Penicillium taxi]KAJ5908721.1 hypothetical protein N7495_001403 [Penicillium taxi]
MLSSSRMPLLLGSVVALGYFSQLVASDSIQSHWTTPDGSESDLSQTFTNGETIAVAWTGWDSGWTDGYMDGQTVADLWVTSFSWDALEYSSLLTTNRNISNAGSYSWTIDISSSALSKSAKYVLRFGVPVTTFNISAEMIDSPGFLVISGSTTTTSSSTSSTTSTTSSSSSTSSLSTTTSSTNADSTTATSTNGTITTSQKSTSTGLSTGAKAGAGVGGAIAGIALIGALAYFIIRRMRKGNSSSDTVPNKDHGDFTKSELMPMYTQRPDQESNTMNMATQEPLKDCSVGHPESAPMYTQGAVPETDKIYKSELASTGPQQTHQELYSEHVPLPAELGSEYAELPAELDSQHYPNHR